MLKVNERSTTQQDEPKVTQNDLPATGFVREKQIIGDKKKGIIGPIPVSRSNWWAGCASGRYPAPIKLSDKITVWRAEDIRRYILEARSGA